jgi:hypothetical protein
LVKRPIVGSGDLIGDPVKVEQQSKLMSAAGLDCLISQFNKQEMSYLVNLSKPSKWPESFLVEREENRLINENVGVK